jgi:hypothetical protein
MAALPLEGGKVELFSVELHASSAFFSARRDSG